MSHAQAADLLYSEAENDLRDSVRSLLTDRCTPDKQLARAESGEPYDLDLWRTMSAEVGTAGLAVPEASGGHGGSAREVALVLEELGRSVAKVPFLGSTVLATTALLAAGEATEVAASLLRSLAAGESVAALAVSLPTEPGAAFPTQVTVDAEGTLTGQVRTVADASAAGVLVVPAVGPDGPSLHAVDTGAVGVTVSEVVSLDLTRPVADVSLAGAPARRLAGGDAAATALDHAVLTGAGLLASEQVGIAEWCLDETVRYGRERHQFGRPVGSFQAIKHRLADLYLELVSARAAARYAADTLAAGSQDVPVAVAVAQAYCAGVAVHAAEECIQLHGGIGMTWEHPAHLYLKRAKADEIAFGSPGGHRARLGGLVDLPG